VKQEARHSVSQPIAIAWIAIRHENLLAQKRELAAL
jgi:hypothetical protein